MQHLLVGGPIDAIVGPHHQPLEAEIQFLVSGIRLTQVGPANDLFQLQPPKKRNPPGKQPGEVMLVVRFQILVARGISIVIQKMKVGKNGIGIGCLIACEMVYVGKE